MEKDLIELKGISFKKYPLLIRFIEVMAISFICYVLVDRTDHLMQRGILNESTAHMLMLISFVLLMLRIFFLAKKEVTEEMDVDSAKIIPIISKDSVSVGVFGNGKNFEASLRITDQNVIMKSNVNNEIIPISKISIVETISDLRGRYGVTFWSGTHIPYKRLLEFVDKEVHEPRTAIIICNVFRDNFKQIKIMDSRKLLNFK